MMSTTTRVLLVVCILLMLVMVPVVLLGGAGVVYFKTRAAGNEKKLEEYRETLGPQLEEARQELAAARAEHARAIEAAWDSLPDDSPISRDWDFLAEAEAGAAGNERLLIDFTQYVLDLGAGGRAELMAEVREELALARKEGKGTFLHFELDPGEHGEEGAVKRFHRFMQGGSLFAKVESAAHAGIPLPPYRDDDMGYADDYDELKWRRMIRWLALRLQACRAVAAAEAGDPERALAICRSLYDVFYTLNSMPGIGIQSLRLTLSSADRALARALREAPAPDDWRDALLERMGKSTRPEILRARILSRALSEPFDAAPWQEFPWYLRLTFEPPNTEFLTFQVFEHAQVLLEHADEPLFQWRDEYQRLGNKTRPQVLLWDEEGKEDADFDTVTTAVRERLDGSEIVGFAIDALLLRVYQWQCVRRREGVLRVVFAVEDYRACHGVYPACLDLLVPDLLDAIPTDPLSGEPLAYEHFNTGFVLLGVCDCTELSDVDVTWQTGFPEDAPGEDDAPEGE